MGSIIDVTDGHTAEGVKDGRALRADGKEVLILVVLSKFERKSILQRQRMINKVLFQDLNNGKLHSVRMRCLTPAQWEKMGKPKTFQPDAPCSDNAYSFRNSNNRPTYSKIPILKPTVTPSLCVCGDYSM